MVHVNAPVRIVLALVAFGALAVRGSTRAEAQSATFKSGVDMVPLTVTVTNTAGKYVTGLTADDFTVFEDGVVQPLSFFASEDVPVDVALVLDTSSSMQADLPMVQSAACGLVATLRESDRGAVVELKDSIGIPRPFTSDRALIERSVRGLSASGSTALYDGLYVMLKEFDRERHASLEVRRQVLILLSDGIDTRSRLAFDDVMDLARRVGVNIYVIAWQGSRTSPPPDPDGALAKVSYSMKTMARESGGRSFFPKAALDLPGIYTAIAQELAGQYALGYVPRPGGDGAFRHVMVRVPPQTHAQARTRSGYYAPRVRAGL